MEYSVFTFHENDKLCFRLSNSFDLFHQKRRQWNKCCLQGFMCFHTFWWLEGPKRCHPFHFQIVLKFSWYLLYQWFPIYYVTDAIHLISCSKNRSWNKYRICKKGGAVSKCRRHKIQCRKNLRNVRNSECYIWTVVRFFVNINFEITTIVIRNSINWIFVDVSGMKVNTFDMYKMDKVCVPIRFSDQPRRCCGGFDPQNFLIYLGHFLNLYIYLKSSNVGLFW